MRRYWFWIGLAAALALIWGATLLFTGSDSMLGSVIDPAATAPPINLPSSQGGIFHLGEQTGKTVLVFFGYTNCPDVCPATLGNMKVLQEDMGSKGKDVEFVFITVDPARDTLDRVKTYVEIFSPDFIGLSASEAEMTPVWEAYGVFRQINNPDNSQTYMVDHSARVYLIDPAGKLRATYIFGTPIEDIEHDVRLIQKEFK